MLNANLPRSIIFALAGLMCLSLIPSAMAQSNGDPATIARSLSADQIIARVEAGDRELAHPGALYLAAQKLMQAGRSNDAVFWFYVGQLRFRIHLAARPDLDRSGDPALFGSLQQTIGQPINRYAFGDIPALAITLERVLAWDASHEDAFTSKGEFAAARASIRDGLSKLRQDIFARQDQIRAERTRNGLPNR